MENKASVAHEGVIEQITPDSIVVRFVAHSACEACHVKGLCSVSDSEEKIVEVKNPGTGFSTGETVEVLLAQTQGFKALAFGYIFPLIMVLLVLSIFYSITGREGFSALLSLGSLVPYYLGVWLFRRRISKSIEFKLKKLE
ncbi:MAG: SoxR reducing system RseC family protein [Bacteroidota bacterium]